MSEPPDPIDQIKGRSQAIEEVKRWIRRAAANDYPVLILGENGTGKELVADAVHRLSARGHGPFIPVNCGAISKELAESELFGHEKGAFTGAHRRKPGWFERAHLGTLFLDEVGDLPLDMQVKLLRALQEKEIERVGGSETIHVDVRVVAATNKDLGAAINKGQFREDLYYRLNSISIRVPPLRDRREDISILAEHFLSGRTPPDSSLLRQLSGGGMSFLESYGWPGNIRELKSCFESADALASSRGRSIQPADLEEAFREKTGPAATSQKRSQEIVVAALAAYGARLQDRDRANRVFRALRAGEVALQRSECRGRQHLLRLVARFAEDDLEPFRAAAPAVIRAVIEDMEREPLKVPAVMRDLVPPATPTSAELAVVPVLPEYDHPHAKLVEEIVYEAGRPGEITVNLVGAPGSLLEKITDDVARQIGRQVIRLDLRSIRDRADLDRQLSELLPEAHGAAPHPHARLRALQPPVVLEISHFAVLLQRREEARYLAGTAGAAALDAAGAVRDALATVISAAHHGRHLVVIGTVVPLQHLRDAATQAVPSGSTLRLLHLQAERCSHWEEWTERVATAMGAKDALDRARPLAQRIPLLFERAVRAARHGEAEMRAQVESAALALHDDLLWPALPECCRVACQAIGRGGQPNETCAESLKTAELISGSPPTGYSPVVSAWQAAWARAVIR